MSIPQSGGGLIEHDGFVLVAFATAKQTVEVLKIRIADL